MVFNARGMFNFELKQGAVPAGESWAESFNSHTDSRPNGPMGIAFDVGFPGRALHWTTF